MKKVFLSSIIIAAGAAQALSAQVPALQQLPASGDMPAVTPPPAVAAQAFTPAHPQLPENCANMPLLYVKNGDLYREGKKLGNNVSSYSGACTGDTAWRDTYGRVYKNENHLGGSVSEYRIALYTGDVVWTDSYGRLHKDAVEIGSAQTYLVADWTGDVAWRDSYGSLYKNSEKLGDSNRFQVASHTGDVIWTDSYGRLYKNKDRLGDSNNYFVADRTGDVAWMDGYANLYLNKTRISTSCQRFELREDGKLLWVDGSGEYHYVSAADRFSPAPFSGEKAVQNWAEAAKTAFEREIEAGGLTNYADLRELPPGARARLDSELATLPQGPGNTSEAFEMNVNGRTAFVIQSYVHSDTMRAWIFNAAGVPVARGEGSVDKPFVWLPL